MRYPELWSGIDLVYSGSVDRLKYQFEVKPGADPSLIRLAYRGATDLTLTDAGGLQIGTPIGSFSDKAPVVYQEIAGRRAPVQARFTLKESGPETWALGFDLGAYDPKHPLVIDPVTFVYAGYIGGADSDTAEGIAVGEDGSAYVTGDTASSETDGFPVTVGPDLTFKGGYDAFVAKVSADGSRLDYAGYIGGTNEDSAFGIAVDRDGSAYVTGETWSSETDGFPVTVGPDLTYNGSGDAFVAKVSADGTGLDYAGYIGGTDNDSGRGITVHRDGSTYVAGWTSSTETDGFPVTVGPDLTYNGGDADAFVAKVDADGSGLDYAGYIGGTRFDYVLGIAVDRKGSAYVAGEAWSSETQGFPVTEGPDLTFNGGLKDAFVAKISADGSGLNYAGYIGGTGQDSAKGIAVDRHGSAYVTGSTFSSETDGFPVALGPDLTHNGGLDAFVAKVARNGRRLEYAGYIGGMDNDSGLGIAVSRDGSAYIAGWTISSETDGFPVALGPDLTHNGGEDAFVAKVARNGRRLKYAGYIGGANGDYGRSIAVDRDENAYAAGRTTSAETQGFPDAVGPDLSYNGSQDAFIAKIGIGWTAAYAAMFVDPANLQTFRAYRDRVLAGDDTGRFCKEVLYENSAQALLVLEDNPDLMQWASALIEAHKEAVARASEGEEAVIDATGEVADFLERFAQESPRELKVMAYLLRWQILQHHRSGEPFLGFTWE